ncbi:hypothetical protein PRK78_004082 [Emydomyces testavorans]|uniref:Glycosyl transferase CAP10 domain-containing protein n=1 Tax=Emydomyces testavorans TaxID=2070801 RepID=A0AAF0DH72_9EURO|nr:hypothetical protein PRK78_004082 [Emydomyces testavorans]
MGYLQHSATSDSDLSANNWVSLLNLRKQENYRMNFPRLSSRHLLFTSGAILILLACFVIFQIDGSQHGLCTPSWLPPITKSKTESNNGDHLAASWVFVTSRDADDYGLSHAQCRTAFPKLFVEIEKAVLARQGKRIDYQELSSRRLEDAMVKAMIYDGELYVLNFESMKYTFTRAKATLSSLNRALTAASERENLPNIEFIFSSEDFTHGPGPIWTYSKREEDTWAWLMPDFGYWTWPEVNIGSYRQVRRGMVAIDDGTFIDGEYQAGIEFQDKHKQLFWRGNAATAPELRQKLLSVTHNKTWASVVSIDWSDGNNTKQNFVPITDHCRYMFLGHVEGRSYSGRGKYLQNCRSVFVTHKLEWHEAHHAALVSSGPEANYVELKRDFSDLEEKITYLIDHPNIAKQIAENNVEVFRDRYLTPAAEACYWRELILAYGRISNFEPTLYHIDSDGKRVRRGVSFESWILDGNLE